MQSDNKPPSFEKLISMIEKDTKNATISGQDCPECGSEDLYGNLDLVILGNHPGISLHAECLYCGEDYQGVSRFSDS